MILAQATQPSGWSDPNVVIPLIAGSIIPAIVAGVLAVLAFRRSGRAESAAVVTAVKAAKVEGTVEAQGKSLDRLAETNRTQAVQISDINKALPPQQQ